MNKKIITNIVQEIKNKISNFDNYDSFNLFLTQIENELTKNKIQTYSFIPRLSNHKYLYCTFFKIIYNNSENENTPLLPKLIEFNKSYDFCNNINKIVKNFIQTKNEKHILQNFLISIPKDIFKCFSIHTENNKIKKYICWITLCKYLDDNKTTNEDERLIDFLNTA